MGLLGKPTILENPHMGSYKKTPVLCCTFARVGEGRMRVHNKKQQPGIDVQWHFDTTQPGAEQLLGWLFFYEMI